jgi:16S rRNA (guanine(966)-N(2))-methyltransferase RsmD
MLRVASGKLKGRKLKAPKGDVRPLGNMAKEALFNILREKVPGSKFLDLFAGSGQIGIEALSCGAESAIFVDNFSGSCKTIRENIKELDLKDFAKLYCMDVLSALKKINSNGEKFDIIFIGAPYRKEIIYSVLDKLADIDIVDNSGIIVAEFWHKQKIPESLKGMTKVLHKKYGDTVLSFYKGAK